MLSYYLPYYAGGNIYSCDNIRLSLEFPSLRQMELFLTWLSKFDVTYYRSLKDFSYRHLFVFPGNTATFSLGLCLNGASKAQDLCGFLDFNPNKVLGELYLQDGFFSCPRPFEESEGRADVFWKVWDMLRQVVLHAYVKRFDFAVDVPVERGKVQLFREDNRTYTQFWKSSSNYTEYLGRKNVPGRVKVYPKNIESELEYPLTRVEVTCESFDYDAFCRIFPRVYIRRMVDLGSSGVMVALLAEVPSDRQDFYLRQFSRPTRNRYKALLVQEPFVVSADAFEAVKHVVEVFQI